MRSAPTSAILVKIPPAIRRQAAPRDSPIANPMKHGPARSPGSTSMMKSMRVNSTLMRTIPMLMPERMGMSKVSHGEPRSDAWAVREFAKVLTRMPYQATPNDPAMPTRLNIKMMSTLAPMCSRNRKYTTITAAMKAHSSMRNLACCLR